MRLGDLSLGPDNADGALQVMREAPRLLYDHTAALTTLRQLIGYNDEQHDALFGPLWLRFAGYCQQLTAPVEWDPQQRPLLDLGLALLQRALSNAEPQRHNPPFCHEHPLTDYAVSLATFTEVLSIADHHYYFELYERGKLVGLWRIGYGPCRAPNYKVIAVSHATDTTMPAWGRLPIWRVLQQGVDIAPLLRRPNSWGALGEYLASPASGKTWLRQVIDDAARDLSLQRYLIETTAPTTKPAANRAARESSTTHHDENGFANWLIAGLRQQNISINQCGSPVFHTDRGLFLVSPSIFKHYDETHWMYHQRRFEKLRLHARRTDGGNIHRLALALPGKTIHLHGYLVRAELLLGHHDIDLPVVASRRIS